MIGLVVLKHFLCGCLHRSQLVDNKNGTCCENIGAIFAIQLVIRRSMHDHRWGMYPPIRRENNIYKGVVIYQFSNSLQSEIFNIALENKAAEVLSGSISLRILFLIRFSVLIFQLSRFLCYSSQSGTKSSNQIRYP
jgi:hypothetical protein